MISSTIRFRNFILFLILIFTFYLIPHLEMSFLYGFHFFFNEARAEEIQAKDTSSKEETQGKQAPLLGGTSALGGVNGHSGASLSGGASEHRRTSGSSLLGGASEHRGTSGTRALGGASGTS